MIAVLLRLLALAAVMLMPLGMSASAAPAGQPAMAGMAGHCDEQGNGDEQGSPEDGAPEAPMDCTGCAALMASAGPRPGIRAVPKLPARVADLSPVPGSVPELATPPPKRG
jgi:hypothetical protein